MNLDVRLRCNRIMLKIIRLSRHENSTIKGNFRFHTYVLPEIVCGINLSHDIREQVGNCVKQTLM